jgi:UDP-3-O-[3-hydroxymyristoyl] glucosamine N-acyltransferase
MKNKKELKKNIQVSSKEIIEFLKEKNLYLKDNGVSNIATNVSSLENSKKHSLSWLKKSHYELDKLKSSIVIVGEDFHETSSSKTLIYTKEPRLAMVFVINHFFLEETKGSFISPLASIDKSATLGEDVIINENVVIASNVVIGNNVVIYPGVTIYPDTIIEDNVVINSACTIGKEGFGYIKDLEGNNIQFPHIGRVVIKKGVEIGANTSIDKGALSDTIIGENSKLNNSVHIAHNVQIGRNVLIAAKVEVSGSVIIEDDVYIGPNAVLIDGIKVAKGAVIGLGAVIRKNVAPNSTMVPFEAVDKATYINYLKVLKKGAK